MAVIPPHPWFSAFSSNSSGRGRFSSSAHLIAVASSLSLGHRCTTHLHLLLFPHSLEGYHSDHLNKIHDFWCRKRDLLKIDALLETLADAFSTSCSSCFSFFNGKESEKGHLNKHRSQFKTSEGNYTHGRLWTNVVLALNVLVYISQVASQGKLTLWGAKVNGLIDKGQLWRLATSSFLHANIGHLLVNCYSLNSVGPTVEQLSGPRRFLTVYCTSAIASSLMSYWFCPSPALGASGAIFGLVGSLAVFVLRHRSLLGGGKQDLQQIGRVIALNMVIGLLSQGIDNWGHLGGLLGGAAMSWFIGPAWKYEFQCDDGRSVFVDRPPISLFINRRRLS